ncbi:MAG: SRPBCC family protein [Burkholderiaceae bacterium]
MVKLIAIIFVLTLMAVLIYAATRPDAFRIERSIRIMAPPQKIHPLINDFRAMQTWSAWEKVDPNAKSTHSGAASGKGAAMAWEGNSEVGAGRMEITESLPEKITLRMEFIKPFAAINTTEFTLRADGDATTVTQAMFGPSPFISKLMGLVFSMDKMVGGKFEESLAALKVVAEMKALEK